MTSVAILTELRGRGARVLIHDGRVRIEVEGELPEPLIELAREHRDDLLDELRREVEPAPAHRLFEVAPLPAPVSRQAGEIALDRRDWTGDEWLAVYLERAATLEYEGGMSRRRAEAVALAELGEQWAEHEIALALGVDDPAKGAR